MELLVESLGLPHLIIMMRLVVVVHQWSLTDD